jgi:hypothetical protein
MSVANRHILNGNAASAAAVGQSAINEGHSSKEVISTHKGAGGDSAGNLMT